MNLQQKGWCSILVKATIFEDGPKNPFRAHRWSPWCWPPTPSRELVLGVKGMGRSTMACRRWPHHRGGPSAWESRVSERELRLGGKPAYGTVFDYLVSVQCSLPWAVWEEMGIKSSVSAGRSDSPPWNPSPQKRLDDGAPCEENS